MGVEGVLGAIDGILIKIKLPAGVRSARKFLCHKSFYALNMQGIAGPDGDFMYINVGHAGATGDGCASRQSKWWTKCENDVFKYSDGYFFIGDAAYSLMPWLVTPFEGSTGGEWTL